MDKKDFLLSLYTDLDDLNSSLSVCMDLLILNVLLSNLDVTDRRLFLDLLENNNWEQAKDLIVKKIPNLKNMIQDHVNRLFREEAI